MKKPKLKDYSTKTLIALSRQNDDEEFNEKIRNILSERYSFLSYKEVYIKYLRSEGTERLALGDALARFLIDDRHFIEERVLESVLPNLKIEELWSLGKNQNPHIRQKAREVIFNILEERKVEDDKIIPINTGYCDDKVKRKIIKLKRRDD